MHTTILLAFCIGAPAAKSTPGKAPDLVGTWRVESQTTGGQLLKSQIERRYHFAADGEWFLSMNGKDVGNIKRAYEIDAKSSPTTINLKHRDTTGMFTSLGIVKVEGGKLYLCVGPSNGERPKSFESPEGSNISLIILRRVKSE
jgi:uncharacterized protein (TIGR03067 family)